MSYLGVDRVHKSYNGTVVLDNVSFNAEKGEWGGVIGPSAAGKSTILKIIAGVERLDQGKITLDGETISSRSSGTFPTLRTKGRGTVLVWQDHMLFDHLTVEENIRFGSRDGNIEEACQLFRVEKSWYGKNATELSGGQKQRVALARAYAASPRVLLLDEPFGQQDAKIREAMLDDLLKVKATRRELTVLLVSHDQDEVFAVADWVVVLSQGRIVGYGKPSTLINEPDNVTLARMVGRNNILHGIAENRRFYVVFGTERVEIDANKVRSHASCQSVLRNGDGAFWAILPATKLRAQPSSSSCKALKVDQVSYVSPRSFFVNARVQVAGSELDLICSLEECKKIETVVSGSVFFKDDDLWLLPDGHQ